MGISCDGNVCRLPGPSADVNLHHRGTRNGGVNRAGEGAVFKLVPEYFPKSVGGVTGLVGAAGGLGGFFPPLVLGMIKQQTGSFTLGFVLLAGFALICLVILLRGSGSGKLAIATGI
jgi:hypothetical protein